MGGQEPTIWLLMYTILVYPDTLLVFISQNVEIIAIIHPKFPRLPRVVSLHLQHCPLCVSVLSIQNMRRLLTPCRSRGRRQPLVYLKLILGTHRIIRLDFLQCAKVKVRELAGVRNRPGA